MNIENDMFDSMWSFLEMGVMKPDVNLLKDACLDLRKMMMQKTAGQRKNKPGDISFDDIWRIKNTIVVEAMALVLSGKLDLIAAKDGD